MSVTCAPRARMAGERLVAGSVDERDLLGPAAPLDGDVEGGDVLGDAARLAGDDVRVADLVQQARLAVVDVPQDGHDRRAGGELVGADAGLDRLEPLGQLLPRPRARARDLDLHAELHGEGLGLLGVEGAVERDAADAVLDEQGPQQRVGADAEVVRERDLTVIGSLTTTGPSRWLGRGARTPWPRRAVRCIWRSRLFAVGLAGVEGVAAGDDVGVGELAELLERLAPPAVGAAAFAEAAAAVVGSAGAGAGAAGAGRAGDLRAGLDAAAPLLDGAGGDAGRPAGAAGTLAPAARGPGRGRATRRGRPWARRSRPSSSASSLNCGAVLAGPSAARRASCSRRTRSCISRW